MTKPKKTDTDEKTTTEKNTTDKTTTPKKNTMDIKLIDSTGRKINMSGSCSDKEIKAIGRAINHTQDQKIEVK